MAKRKVKNKIGLPYNRFDGEGESMNMIQKPGAVANDAFDSSNLGGTIGSIGSGATSIVQAGMNNAQIADTSSIQDQIKAQNNMVVGASDNASLLNEWSHLSMLKDNYSWKDVRGGSNANKAMNTVGGAAQGAMTGATVGGPIGAIAGAVIGLGSGIAGWITGDKKAKRRARRLNKQASDANERALLSFENRASDIDTQNDLNIESNFFNDGGPITMRYTGVMSPFGNTFGDGGIFIKPENRGKFTALKERTGKSSTWYKEHGTPAQKKMAIFALNAAKWKHADGGELHTQGGDFTNGLTYIDNGGSHEANPFEGVQMGIDPQGVPNLVEEGEVIFNDYVFSDRMKLPKKLKEKYNIKGETFADAAKELSKESEERPNDPISKRGLQAFMSALANGQEEVRIMNEDRKMNRYAKGGRLGNLFDGTGNKSNKLNPHSNFVPLTGDSLYTPEELTGGVTKVKGIRQSPLRYAPLIGSGTAALNDIFGGNDPDYSNADMFASAISSANRPIGTRPIGEYLAYKPLDRMFYINQLNKDTAAGRRAIQDTSGGNRAAALAGILAADYNYGENLGKLARQAEEYNQALKEKVTGFNRQTNMFNSEQGTKVDMFNSELLGKQASLYGQLADMKQKILEGNRAEKSANLTNFIQGLGDLGRELTDRDTLRWLANIGALPYNTRGQYTGGNNTAAPKKSKSGKIKRNKKKGSTI